jgi:threonine aldolase
MTANQPRVGRPGPAPIELRSDTFTRPTAGMRQAIAEAVVGDDAYGEDPQVKALESRCAELFGMEAALFTSSGTMSNQLAVRAQTRPGDEVVLEHRYHVHYYESAATSSLAGVTLHPVTTGSGVLTWSDVATAFAAKPRGPHYSRVSLVCIENTIGQFGGSIYPLSDMEELARNLGPDVAVHLDGARIANASVATGIPLARYAASVNTVSMCFSKALGAPFGSILAGSADVIDRARRYRKWYGGGLHQSGMVAAAALHALDHHHIERLEQDHANARLLARLLCAEPCLGIDLRQVQTNMVLIDVAGIGITASDFAEAASAQGVNVLPWAGTIVRAVTHLDVDTDQIHRASERLLDTARAAMRIAA